MKLYIVLFYLQLLSLSLTAQSVNLPDYYPAVYLGGMDTVRVSNKSGWVFMTIRTDKMSPRIAIDLINNYLRQIERCGWVMATQVVDDMTSFLVQPNNTGMMRSVVLYSTLPEIRAIRIIQDSFDQFPVSYNVRGGGRIVFGESVNIILDGSEPGVEYKLFNDRYFVSVLTGTGGPLTYDNITELGNYKVIAYKNGISREMENVTCISYYSMLRNRIKLLTNEVEIPPNGGEVRVPFTLTSVNTIDSSDFKAIIKKYNSGKIVGWDPSVRLNGEVKDTNGYFIIRSGPNLREEARSFSFVYRANPFMALHVKQPTGGQINRYDLTGGREQFNEGSFAGIKIEGTPQPCVNYYLYRYDVLVGKLNGIGLVVNKCGQYKVLAEYDGREVWMNNVANLFPRVLVGVIKDSTLIKNGEPENFVKLSVSMPHLVYRLLKDGKVVAETNGTGKLLVFQVDVDGVYTVEGGIPGYFVPMTGSVTFNGLSGLFSPLRHYVAERSYIESTSDHVKAKGINSVTYFDGLGRKSQEIVVNAVPAEKADLITPHVYGIHGRVEKTYLSYTKAGNDGKYDPDFVLANRSFYQDIDSYNATAAFSLIKYDDSPLDRVVNTIGPGTNWHYLKKGKATSYGVNVAGEVKLYQVDDNGKLQDGGFYTATTLLKTISLDEDSCRVETFKDREERTVLSVAFEGDNRLETYSVYDDRGLLRYVLSPEGSFQLSKGINEVKLQQLSYYYEYDRWGRMILKRLPGCDPVYMAYDKRDRLVMSQDGKQRASDVNKWSYCLYDEQNREIESGEVVVTSGNHQGLQALSSVNDNYVPSGVKSATSYTVYDSYPTSGTVVAHAFQGSPGYATAGSRRVTGLVTNTKSKVIDSTRPVKWLTSTSYYDDFGRVILVVSDNILGFKSRVEMTYDFVGNVLKTRETHGYSVTGADVLETTNTYDDFGKLLTTTSVLNNGTPASVEYVYNGLGWLRDKKYKLNTSFLLEQMYYNPRGWLVGKLNSSFSMWLEYEQNGGISSKNCFNGNISRFAWRHGNNPTFNYELFYDKVNRLKGCEQSEITSIPWFFLPDDKSHVEKGMTYDRNGNILMMKRTGTPGVVPLVYTYTGNQLTDFKKGGVSGTYAYDKNGSMVKDARKNLNLDYNVLNLLSVVRTGADTSAVYSYSSDGMKLRVRDKVGNGFYYLGSLTYKRSGAGLQLEGAMFGDGRILANASSRVGSELRYFLTDHLGSVRVIVDQTGTVRERNDYYPFGGRYPVTGSGVDAGSRWKYNGKEEQTTGGLGFLDYGARMYDSEVGRWFGVDPKADKYLAWNPYHYCSCNPFLLVDLYGEEGLPYFMKFAYTSNPFLNFLKILPNTAANIVNGGIAFVNSGIATVETLSSGGVSGYLSGLGNEMRSLGTGIRDGVSSMASYHTNTAFSRQLGDAGRSLVSADSWESSLTLGGSLLMGSIASNAGKNLLMSMGKTTGTSGSVGLTNEQLVQRAATWADGFVPFTSNAMVTGTLKHEAATRLLTRYQNIYGYKGLEFKVRQSGAVLDVRDISNGVIYDWKFGFQGGKAIWQLNNSPQMLRYQSIFGLPTQVIRP